MRIRVIVFARTLIEWIGFSFRSAFAISLSETRSYINVPPQVIKKRQCHVPYQETKEDRLQRNANVMSVDGTRIMCHVSHVSISSVG